MKKCLASLAPRKMQIKTTSRFHLSLVKTAVIKKANKCWAGIEHSGVEDREGTLLAAMRISAALVEIGRGSSKMKTRI